MDGAGTVDELEERHVVDPAHLRERPVVTDFHGRDRVPQFETVDQPSLAFAAASASSTRAGSPLPWAKSGLPPPLPERTASASLRRSFIAGPLPFGRAKQRWAGPSWRGGGRGMGPRSGIAPEGTGANGARSTFAPTGGRPGSSPPREAAKAPAPARRR